LSDGLDPKWFNSDLSSKALDDYVS